MLYPDSFAHLVHNALVLITYQICEGKAFNMFENNSCPKTNEPWNKLQKREVFFPI